MTPWIRRSHYTYPTFTITRQAASRTQKNHPSRLNLSEQVIRGLCVCKEQVIIPLRNKKSEWYLGGTHTGQLAMMRRYTTELDILFPDICFQRGGVASCWGTTTSRFQNPKVRDGLQQRAPGLCGPGVSRSEEPIALDMYYR